MQDLLLLSLLFLLPVTFSVVFFVSDFFWALNKRSLHLCYDIRILSGKLYNLNAWKMYRLKFRMRWIIYKNRSDEFPFDYLRSCTQQRLITVAVEWIGWIGWIRKRVLCRPSGIWESEKGSSLEGVDLVNWIVYEAVELFINFIIN